MKRSKKLISLLAVLVVLCVGTVLLNRAEETKEQITATGEIVLEVPADSVQSLNWEMGETSLSFRKTEGTWLYEGDEAFPVDGEQLEEMLDLFSAFGVSFVIEDVTDEGLYGLDEPVGTIEFATEDQTYTVRLGDYSSMDEERYVSIGDGRVYLAKVDPMEVFDAALDDVMLHDRSLSYGEVQTITFSGAENYTIFRQEDSDSAYCAEDVYFVERDGETVPLDTGRIGTYLEALTTLHLTDYVTYNVTDEELKAYDLAAPELTITVDYTDPDGAKQTYTLSVSRDPEELAAAEAAEANGEEAEDVTAYVRVGDSQIVYRVSEYNSNSLRAASYNELRHREVLIADFEDVTQMDITLEEESFTLTMDGTDDEDEAVWKCGDEEVSVAPLQEALETLSVEYSADFTSEQPTGKTEISLTVHLDRETRPTVQIDLYRLDGTHCLAVVDGEVLARVSRSDVVDLIEAVHAMVLK